MRLRLEYRLAEPQSQGRSHEPFTYEVLMLSSGGQFGAFGVGVLQGWAEVQDPSFQRPEFDLVTGVSTGALIAPFSLLGTVHSIQRIDQLYREASDRLATLRGLLFFLPQQPSFFDSQPLADRIALKRNHGQRGYRPKQAHEFSLARMRANENSCAAETWSSERTAFNAARVTNC